MRTSTMLLFFGSIVFIAPAWAVEKQEENPDNQSPNGTTIEGGQVVLAVSESGRTVHGYSTITGQSEKVTLDPKVNESVVPTVGGDFAAFVHGTKAYAFGAQSGKWGVVDLGVNPNQSPTLHRAHVQLRTGSKIYLFSSVSSKWTLIDLSAD